MIHPSLWEDPNFNNLSDQARLLFIGLFSNADDDGYFRADAKTLRRLVFGYSDKMTLEDVVTLLAELHLEMKTVHFYVDENRESYGHFTKWEKFQKQKKDRRKPTMYPLCPICRTSVGQVSDIGRTNVPVSKVKLSKEKKSYKRKKFPTENFITNYLLQIPKKDLEEFEYRYQCTETQILNKANEMLEYCKRKKIEELNFKKELGEWLKKDFGERYHEEVAADAAAVSDAGRTELEKARKKLVDDMSIT